MKSALLAFLVIDNDPILIVSTAEVKQVKVQSESDELRFTRIFCCSPGGTAVKESESFIEKDENSFLKTNLQ